MVQKTVTLSNANELSSWFKEGYRKKTWWIQDTLFISLLEHSHWIHCGTTGLRTWPSELALIEFIYKHPELLSSMVKPNRPCRVLEIGAGTGLFSFFLSRFQPSFQLWVTDVHPEVLRLLHFNATTHHVTDGKKEGRPPLTSSRTTPSSSLPNFQIQAFDFVHQSFNELGHTMDLIVCADVMYDADTLPLYRNLPSDVPCLLAYPHRHQTNTTLSWLTSPTFDCQWQGKLSLFPSDEPFSNISIYSRHLPLFF
ncbi:hypothetical protein HMI54_005524 [Coelomomyces lativittatus]|nr:hypothetical protein HMI54_005524 [Coelomomyces lativittatus]